MPPTSIPVRFGEPVVLACKSIVAANLGSTLSPDRNDLAILFDDFQVQSQPPQASRSDFAAVSLAVPLEPPAKALRVRVDLDLRGHLVKSAGAHAALVIAVGDTLVTRTFELGGAIDRTVDVSLRESMPAHPGGKLVERVVVTVWASVARQSADDAALLTVDSLDLNVQAT